MRLALTDQAIRAVRPPTKGRIEIADVRCTGLAYRVTAAGARTWNFRFRDPTTGRTTRATLGAYPALGLADARSAADALRKQVSRGINPVLAKRRARAEAHRNTFAALAERYLTEHAARHKKPRSAAEDARNLRLHVLPEWGSRPYESIARRDVIELLESIVNAGTPIAANRVHAVISTVFSFAIDCDLIAANPASRLRKRGVETKKTRTLTDDEIRLLWARSVLSPISRPVGLALRLKLLTGLRASEVAGLGRTEIEHLDDPERAALTVPGERTKNGRAHYVPLSPLAVEALHEALTLSADDRQVFGVEGHALAVAMRRMADKLPDAPGVDTWCADTPTPHDLRRTCATRLAGLGVPGEDVSAVLGHTPQHITKQVYDKYDRAREKRVALAVWAAALEHILEPASVGAIVPLTKGRAR